VATTVMVGAVAMAGTATGMVIVRILGVLDTTFLWGKYLHGTTKTPSTISPLCKGFDTS
jgi:hypothetical protein